MQERLEETEVNIERDAPKRPRRTFGGFVKKLLRLGFRLVVSFLFLLLVLSLTLVLLTQTSGFRSWMLGMAVNYANENIAARVEIDEVGFNPFKGITVEGLRLLGSGDTIANVQKLYIDPNYGKLFDQQVEIEKIEVSRPVIRLLRSKADSNWNVNKIAKPSQPAPPSEPSAPPSWLVNLKSVRVSDGKFSMIDSLYMDLIKSPFVNYFDMQLDSINVDLALEYFLQDNSARIRLNNVSFREINSGIRLKKLYMNAILDSSHVTLDELGLYTDYTKLYLRGDWQKINVFSTVDAAALDKSILHLFIESPSVGLPDISRFGSFDPVFEGVPSFSAEILGNMSDLDIKRMLVNAGQTSLLFKGRFINLSHPQDIQFDATVHQSKIYYKDFERNLPKDLAGTIPQFEFLSIKETRIVGDTKHFDIDLNAESTIGNARGKVSLVFSPELTYKTDIDISNINPASLLRNPSLAGDFNARVKASGTGTDLAQMKADADITVYDSRYGEIPIDELHVLARIDRAVVRLDTVGFYPKKAIDNTFFGSNENEKQSVVLSGEINMANPKLPVYSLHCSIANLAVDKLLSNSAMPRQLSANFQINGSGLHPDSLKTNIKASIDECDFGDKALFPFEFSVEADHEGDEFRSITVVSPYVEGTLSGDFDFSTLLGMLSNQGAKLSEFIDRTVTELSFDSSLVDLTKEFSKTAAFAPLSISIKGKIIDLSPIAAFLPKGTNLIANAEADISLVASDTITRLDIKKVLVTDFEYSTNGSRVKCLPVNIYGSLEMVLRDSLPEIKSLDLSLEGDNTIFLNDVRIDKPRVNVALVDGHAEIITGMKINRQYEVTLVSNLNLYADRLVVDASRLRFNYKDNLHWQNRGNIKLTVSRSGLSIDSLCLFRSNSEIVNASGVFANGSFKDFVLTVDSMPLNLATQLLGDAAPAELRQLSGRVDRASVSLRGTMQSPLIDMNFATSELFYKKIPLGVFSGSLSHADSVIKGKAAITRTENGKKKNIFDVDVRSFPMNLGFSGVEKRTHHAAKVDIVANGVKTPLEIISPFVPSISKLSGWFDADISAYGDIESYTLTGGAKVKNGSFLLDPNNLFYNFDADIAIDSKEFIVKAISLRNVSDDYPKGSANISGRIQHENFTIKNIELNIFSDGIMLMNKASMKPMPTMYGPFVISTGKSGLSFHGSLEAPVLEGDVNVLDASLTMPNTIASQAVTSRVIYHTANRTAVIDSVFTEAQPADTASKVEELPKASIVDLMKYRLSVRFLGKFIVTMQIGLQTFNTQIYADIGTANPREPLIVEMEGRNYPKILGKILLKEGSKLSFFKTLSTTGNITFPTGSIDNPGIALLASYSGQTTVDSKMTDFTVNISITGTKNRPNISFGYTIGQNAGVGDSSQIFEDAITLLLANRRKSDLISPSQSSGSFMNDLKGVAISSALASTITSALGGNAIIQNADLDMTQGSFETARLKISGVLFGNVVWRIGGTVSDLTNNNEFSIDIPLPLVLHPELLNNIILQITAATNTAQTTNRNQKAWEVKLKFGGSW